MITIKKEKPEGTQLRAIPAKKNADKWILRLYVAGETPKSITAFKNLNAICEEQLGGKYHIEVIDLLKNPQLCREDQILAVPTLVRKIPQPMRKIIGDLSNTERVLVGLDLIGNSSNNKFKAGYDE